jgi:hypothetical protein
VLTDVRCCRAQVEVQAAAVRDSVSAGCPAPPATAVDGASHAARQQPAPHPPVVSEAAKEPEVRKDAVPPHDAPTASMRDAPAPQALFSLRDAVHIAAHAFSAYLEPVEGQDLIEHTLPLPGQESVKTQFFGPDFVQRHFLAAVHVTVLRASGLASTKAGRCMVRYSLVCVSEGASCACLSVVHAMSARLGTLGIIFTQQGRACSLRAGMEAPACIH